MRFSGRPASLKEVTSWQLHLRYADASLWSVWAYKDCLTVCQRT